MQNKRVVKGIYQFHRWSGMLLILLVGLKLISGFSIAGNLELFAQKTGYRIHYAQVVDIPLLFCFIMHAAYGILKGLWARVSLNKQSSALITTVVGFLVFALSILFIYFI